MKHLSWGKWGALVVLVAGCATVDSQSVGLRMPDLSRVNDGQWTGEATVDPVYARVAVTVEGHRIAGFTILEHRKGLGGPAEVLAQRVVERQTVLLDAVSGATYSSYAILKAGEEALEKGLR